MKDEKIIELLKKIVDEKLLNGVLIDNAIMCIEFLKNGGSGEIENIRMMAKNLIKRASLIPLNNAPNSFDVDDDKILTKIPKIVEEIRTILNTKDLDKDLITCLEFVIEDLTSEKISKEQKIKTIQNYHINYKSAIDASDEYIPETSNHKR